MPAFAMIGCSYSRPGLRHLCLGAATAACALLLSGCGDPYAQTCVWHSDLTIKGCSYWSFRSCIENCEYCVDQDGPDECGQLKCAAYCAKQDDDAECLSNYKALCDIAVSEQDTVQSCDVDCSPASRVTPLWPALLAALLLLPACDALQEAAEAVRPGRILRGLPLVLAISCAAVMLHGCCDDPDHQLSWDPDFSALEERAQWYDEDGIWQGNPSWRFTPEHEAENYKCKTMHENRSVCMVWTAYEWNCDEHDFGLCKCYELPSEGDYCQAWGCFSLEASQEVCEKDTEGDEDCSYEPFHWTEEKYEEILSKQHEGDDESVWWSFDAPTVSVGGNEQSASGRRLSAHTAFPPASAFSPAFRYRFFWLGDICIANGDNVNIVREQCSRWREIETEISQCFCKKGSGQACEEWYCEERDVGLFSVLFRTTQSIVDFVHGSEQENYTCKQFSGSGSCTAWEGDISGLEEVELTRCECTDSSDCRAPDAQWKCDEYELPKRLDMSYPTMVKKWIWFLIVELLLLAFMLCGTCGSCGVVYGVAGSSELGCLGCCLSSCGGIILLPFLVVTWGLGGFMKLGLPFWIVRGLCALGLLGAAAYSRCQGGKGTRSNSESTRI